MADITMCDDGKCPLKDICYRFRAKASEYWQSYFTESPRKKRKCEYYWEMTDRDLKGLNDAWKD